MTRWILVAAALFTLSSTPSDVPPTSPPAAPKWEPHPGWNYHPLCNGPVLPPGFCDYRIAPVRV